MLYHLWISFVRGVWGAQEFWANRLGAAEGLGWTKCILSFALFGLCSVRQLGLGTLFARNIEWYEATRDITSL